MLAMLLVEAYFVFTRAPVMKKMADKTIEVQRSRLLRETRLISMMTVALPTNEEMEDTSMPRFPSLYKTV